MRPDNRMYTSTQDDQLVDTAYISSAAVGSAAASAAAVTPADNDSHSTSSSCSSTSSATSCDEGLRESISPIPSTITSIIIRQVAKADLMSIDKQFNPPIAKPRLSKIRAQQRQQKLQQMTFHPSIVVTSNEIDNSTHKTNTSDIFIMNNLVQSNNFSVNHLTNSQSNHKQVDIKRISIIECVDENLFSEQAPKYAPSEERSLQDSTEHANESHVYNESFSSQTDCTLKTVNSAAKNVTLENLSQQFKPKRVPFNINTSSETSYQTCGINSHFLEQESQGQDISASPFISKSLPFSLLSLLIAV